MTLRNQVGQWMAAGKIDERALSGWPKQILRVIREMTWKRVPRDQASGLRREKSGIFSAFFVDTFLPSTASLPSRNSRIAIG